MLDKKFEEKLQIIVEKEHKNWAGLLNSNYRAKLASTLRTVLDGSWKIRQTIS